MKKWMQGIGLVYMLMLLGICTPRTEAGNAQNDTGEVIYLTIRDSQLSGTDSQAGKPKEALGAAGEIISGEHPRIALTFDDGPNAIHTPVLLDGLKERDVKATFF